MKNSIIALSFGALITSTLACADEANSSSGLYLGAAYNALSIEDELDFKTLDLQLGTRINDYFSVEVRAGIGLDGEEYSELASFYDIREKLEINQYFGAYVIAGYPLTERIRPYAFIGYSSVELEYSVSASGIELEEDFSSSEADSENDMSYGAGIVFSINDALAVKAEYINLIDKEGVALDGFGVGFSYKF